MKGFTYESQGAETMLVYRLQEEEHLDSFAKGMLQGNEMTGILRPSFMQRNKEQYLKFPVTSRIVLEQFIQREMEKETILNLLFTMVSAIQEVEEYMLSPEKILLDPEYIFVNIRQKEAGLLYLPVDEFVQNITVKDFFLYLLSHMQYQLDKDVSYVAKLIHFLNQQKPWTFEELKRQIKELQEEHEETAPLRGQDPVAALMPEPVLKREPLEVQNRNPMDSSDRVVLPAFEEPDNQLQKGIGLKPEEKKKGGLFSFGKKKEKAQQTQGVLLPPSGMGTPSQSTVPSGMVIPGRPIPPSGIGVSGQPAVIPGEGILSQAGPASGMAIPVRANSVSSPVLENQQAEKKGTGKWPFGRNKKGGNPEKNPIPEPELHENPGGMAAYQPSSPSPSYEQAGKKASVYMDYGSSDEESRTVIMGGGMDYGSTMILGMEQNGSGQVFTHVVKIMRRRTGQSMVINKDLFRIGSEASFVDLFIGDNMAIGSCHANISCQDGMYYIMDQNSVNHTYVNGRMVRPGEMVQLTSGSVITLADEDFDFVIS